MGFLCFGDLFWTPTVPFDHFCQFFYQKYDKLTKVPTGVKFGVFLGIWKIGCTASVLRFKKFSYMPVLMSQGGVFHRGVKPPNSKKVYHKCFVARWLPHLIYEFLIKNIKIAISFLKHPKYMVSSPNWQNYENHYKPAWNCNRLSLKATKSYDFLLTATLKLDFLLKLNLIYEFLMKADFLLKAPGIYGFLIKNCLEM